MSTIDHPVLPVALVFGDAEASKHLRQALDEIGARIVCDTPVDTLDSVRIEASGAGVVLVNLDDDVGDHLDEVYESLDESRYRVIFNDPESSQGLSGWEHARWLRHLAAKLRDDSDIDPPRPEGAEAPGGSEADRLADAWVSDALGVLADEPTASVPSAARVTDVSVEPAREADQPIATGAEFSSDASTETVPETSREAAPDMLLDLDMDAIALEMSALVDEDDANQSSQARLDDETQAAATVAPGVDVAPAAEMIEFDLPSTIDLDSVALFDEDSAARTESEEPGAELDLDAAFADFDEHAGLTVASDDPADESISLQDDLNAAFGDDALAAIDEASASHVSAASSGVSLDESVESFEFPGGDDATTPPVPVAAAPVAPEKPFAFDLTDPDEPIATAPPAATEPVAVREFNLDHLSLVELEADVPVTKAFEAVEHRLDPDAPRPARADDEAKAAQADVANTTTEAPAAAQDFGLELVATSDYLAPDAPAATHDEDVVAPQLMSLSEAVAPEVEGESSSIAKAAALEPPRHVVILAASIGGPDAVREFLSVLPERFPVTLVLVQHLGSEFIDLMVGQLAKSSALPVRQPRNGDRAFNSEVLVVAQGRRFKMNRAGEIELGAAPDTAAKEPAINYAMSMAAETYGADALGIVFSGMAPDAVAGTLEIASRGGEVWAQEPASCIVSSMVDGVIAAGVARFVGTPRALGEHLLERYAAQAGAN